MDFKSPHPDYTSQQSHHKFHCYQNPLPEKKDSNNRLCSAPQNMVLYLEGYLLQLKVRIPQFRGSGVHPIQITLRSNENEWIVHVIGLKWLYRGDNN